MMLLVALLVLAVAVAWWGFARTRNATDYFAAGRTAGSWLVGVAGTAAALSAFTFVGGPGLFAVAGAGSLWIILSAPLTGALQCWAVGEPLALAARDRKLLTIPELLGARFESRVVRAVAAGVIVVGCVASLAVQARAAAVLGEHFLDLSGPAAATLALLATTLYTALGGMRAGIFADAVQGAVMAIAAVVLACAAVAAAGGPQTAVDTLARARPDLLGAFGAVPPARAFSWWLLFCLGTCAQPHYLQKFLFLRAPGQLRLLPWSLTAALLITLTVWIGVGLGGAALVADGAISIERPDDLAPRTVAFIGPWAVLLAGVGVLAALMSTSASFLNLAAAAITRDFPEALRANPLRIGAARWATLFVALLGTALGLSTERAVALLGVAGWGFFTAALLPVLTLGLHWTRVTGGGAALAMLSGAALATPLELARASLPAGLEPGLVGAGAGAVVLLLTGAAARDRQVLTS